jgi:hypothetical protein
MKKRLGLLLLAMAALASAQWGGGVWSWVGGSGSTTNSSASIAPGTVVPWWGDSTAWPAGYRLCDGINVIGAGGPLSWGGKRGSRQAAVGRDGELDAEKTGHLALVGSDGRCRARR